MAPVEVCAIFALIILIVGSSVVVLRPKSYQATSSVALLPVSTNSGVLPNYPNLITSLIPTYVQLVSSPVLLNRVAATLPFHTTGTALAGQVHAEALSNAAVINIVAQSSSPAQAQQISIATTRAFLVKLQGNGVVVPQIFALPTTGAQPAPPRTSLLLLLVLVLAVVFGLGAGLIWDRLSAPPGTGKPDQDQARGHGPGQGRGQGQGQGEGKRAGFEPHSLVYVRDGRTYEPDGSTSSSTPGSTSGSTSGPWGTVTHDQEELPTRR